MQYRNRTEETGSVGVSHICIFTVLWFKPVANLHTLPSVRQVHATQSTNRARNRSTPRVTQSPHPSNATRVRQHVIGCLLFSTSAMPSESDWQLLGLGAKHQLQPAVRNWKFVGAAHVPPCPARVSGHVQWPRAETSAVQHGAVPA